jgi:hypothetical protein
MSQKVNLGRQGFLSPVYKNAIDTSFTQLIPPPPPIEEEVTVEQFFEFYTQLFYEIPAEGSINSHQVLIDKSKEYIGFTEEHDKDIQILLDEITQLREELLATQKELTDAQSNNAINTDPNALLEGTQITGDGVNSNLASPTSTTVVGGNTVSRRY